MVESGDKVEPRVPTTMLFRPLPLIVTKDQWYNSSALSLVTLELHYGCKATRNSSHYIAISILIKNNLVVMDKMNDAGASALCDVTS